MPAKERRKKMPYAIGGLLDEAICANSSALHALEPLLEDKKIDPADQNRRIGRAVHEIHVNDRALHEIKSIQQEGKE